VKKLLLATALFFLQGYVFAQSLNEVANKIGIQRSIYCAYAGANLEQQNGYGDKSAAAVGRAVRIVYINLVNTFPSGQVEAVSNSVGKQMSTMTADDRMLAPLKCSQEPLVSSYLKQAMAMK
jgi:hypothetical protein